MLSVQNVSVSFGGEYLFRDISFRLGPGNRVGLVGKNGAGKSTLLHLIARDTPVSEGSISQEKIVQLGFLKQDIDFDYGRTVLEEAYQAFTEIKVLEQQILHLEEDLNYLSNSKFDYKVVLDRPSGKVLANNQLYKNLFKGLLFGIFLTLLIISIFRIRKKFI